VSRDKSLPAFAIGWTAGEIMPLRGNVGGTGWHCCRDCGDEALKQLAHLKP